MYIPTVYVVALILHSVLLASSSQTKEKEIGEEIADRVKVLSEQVELKKNELKFSCRELKMMEEQIRNLEEKKQTLILQEKATEHKLAKLKKDLKDANTLVEQMLQNTTGSR